MYANACKPSLSSRKRERTISAERFSSQNLLVEESLALFYSRRIAGLVCLVDPSLDRQSLPVGGSIGLFLLRPSLSPLIPSQIASELWVLPALEIEVGKICYKVPAIRPC